MTEWKQDAMPKRMQESIKATRDRIKQAQREEIKKSALVSPVINYEPTSSKPKIRATKPKLPQPSIYMERVAAIQNQVLHTLPSRPVLTHKRRRWMRKHPGFPINQYPMEVQRKSA